MKTTQEKLKSILKGQLLKKDLLPPSDYSMLSAEQIADIINLKAKSNDYKNLNLITLEELRRLVGYVKTVRKHRGEQIL
ncbi:hypothetical protein QNI16_14670 [Cytophagaceae bacterium YF14B1]|uniref:Uncharacterized protein n=1 Tax=Xanthocytophaga flava TaxID=3048013 RepID=A0AAE3U6W2_9BACT|nr:hypothetical protein [Xanthocytophaga flavus]MDJ1481741.1 hypothetical protein [Xanthocytophaga flavus]